MKKLLQLSSALFVLSAPAFAQDPAPETPPPAPVADSAPPAPAPIADATPAPEAPPPAPMADATPASEAAPLAPVADAPPPPPAATTYTPPREPTTNQYIGFLPGFLRPDPSRGAGLHGFTASVLYGHDIGAGFSAELNLAGAWDDINTRDRRAFHQESATLDIAYAPFGVRGVSAVTPFLIAGAGGAYNDVYQRSDFKGSFIADGGIGLVTGEVIKPLRIRAEVRYLYNNFEGVKNDARASLGFEIPIGEPKAPPRTEFLTPPAQVVAVTDEVDSDHDTVPDSRDQCPGTPEGIKVDATGCPLVGAPIALPGVNFKTDSAKLQPSSIKALKKALDYLADNPTANVEVAGHTDATGKPAHNLKLSQARAETVRQYLVGKGVKASRLTAKGYGSNEPLKSPETTTEDKAINRRVELRARP